MDNKNQLIVRTSRLLFLFLFFGLTALILWTVFGPYEKTRIIFENNFYVAVGLSLLILGSTIFVLYKLLDNRPVIIISQDGIWTKKTGTVLWQNIPSYYAKSTAGEYFNNSTFFFKVSGQKDKISISTTFLSPDNNKIIEFIEKNCTNKDTCKATSDFL